MKVLNLCAGMRPMKDAINTDIVKIYPDYLIWDLNKKSKFKNNTFDKIYAIEAINYIQPQNFIKVMEELYRIAKPNALIILGGQTTNSKTSMFIKPFRLHTNDIKNFFTERGWYSHTWNTKARFEIIEERWNNIFKRFATIIYYKLRVLK